MLGLPHPVLRIVVAIVDDAAVLVHRVGDDMADLLLLVLCTLQTSGKGVEGVGQDGVEHHLRIGQRLGGADHAELKLVAGEGKGRGAVAVGLVLVTEGIASTPMSICSRATLLGLPPSAMWLRMPVR